jgi:hypothetical protein
VITTRRARLLLVAALAALVALTTLFPAPLPAVTWMWAAPPWTVEAFAKNGIELASETGTSRFVATTHVSRGASGDAAPTLRGDALWVEKSESASALVYWSGDRFEWYQLGD